MIKNQDDKGDKPDGPVKKNDLRRDITGHKMLARVNLDLDSPRLKMAMDNLGVGPEEMIKK